MNPATPEMIRAYETNRSVLAGRALELLSGLAPEKRVKAVGHLFWESFYCGADGLPKKVYGPEPRGKFNCLDFSADPETAPQIETRGPWKRLRVTVSRVLPLCKYASADAWFDSLSQKNRKKLRWLRNAVPKLGAEIRPVADEKAFLAFEKLYFAQFGGDPELMEKGVRTLYSAFGEENRAFCRELAAPDGTVLASALGFLSGEAFFYTHLTRGAGNPEWDRYSPGFYLTYSIIRELYETHPEIRWFFMGPGDYDYKHAFLGEILPVYRYERSGLGNLFGLLRMRHRLRKETAAYLESHRA